MTSIELGRLQRRLALETRLLVAFSGGADSALLAAVAHQVLGRGALAVTAVSASLPGRERVAARRFTTDLGIAHVEVCTDELTRPEYVMNGADRCFHCKSALFDAVEPLAQAMAAAVALGTNVDDLSEHRPGLRAARERGTVAPLVDAGLTKAAVRRVSAELGLPTAAKPAAACLASRVAYGDEVTAEILARVEVAEDALADLGFRSCRVRSHAGGTVARVEVPPGELPAVVARREVVVAAVNGAGFTFCALDLTGLRSGSMNALLSLQPRGGPA